MSAVAAAFPEPCSGFPRKYEWERWTDGQIHICKRGEDFFCSPRRFAQTAWMHAERHGFSVQTNVRGRFVFIQFRRRRRQG